MKILKMILLLHLGEKPSHARERVLVVERLSSRLNGVVHNVRTLFSCANAMDEWADEMRTLGQAFSTLEPQLTHASEMVREELRELNAIEEGDLHVRFGGKIAEYKKVRFVHAAQESFYYRTHNMDLHPHYLHI
jgi:hypothetical protein